MEDVLKNLSCPFLGFYRENGQTDFPLKKRFSDVVQSRGKVRDDTKQSRAVKKQNGGRSDNMLAPFRFSQRKRSNRF